MAGAITILIFLAQDRDFNVDHREAALFGAGVAATVILIALMLAGQAGVPGDLEI